MEETVSIRSSFVCFGTIRCHSIRPTTICTENITVTVKELVGKQRVTLLIAFKHILRAVIGRYSDSKGLILQVNKFCAKRIRETFLVPGATEGAVQGEEGCFDVENPKPSQRLIVVDISSCNDSMMRSLQSLLVEAGRQKQFAKNSAAKQDGQTPVIQSDPIPFLDFMDEEAYKKLLREIGIPRSIESAGHGNISATRVSNTSSVTEAAPSQSTADHRRSLHPLSSKRQTSEVERSGAAHLTRQDRTTRPTSPPILAVPLTVVHAPQQSRLQSYTQQQQLVHSIQQRSASVQHIRPVSIVAVPVTQPTSSLRVTQMERRSSLVPVVQGSSISHSRTQFASPIVGQQPSTSLAIMKANSSTTPTMRRSPTHYVTNNGNPRLPATVPRVVRPTRSANKRVVHIDEDDAEYEVGGKRIASEDMILQYPRGQRGAVSLHFLDLDTLKPEGMLNDTIIDFYLKYIHNEKVPQERRHSIFIYNTFFYGRLTQLSAANSTAPLGARTKWIQTNYQFVKNWTKGVDIFSMDYLVVPINEELHWYLAIIAFPRAALEYSKENGVVDGSVVPGCSRYNPTPVGLQKAQIIILDSLKDDTDLKRKFVGMILGDYLDCEYSEKRKEKAPANESFSKRRIETISRLAVPQQRNYTDCGLYVLKYAEYFLRDPPMFVSRTNDSFLRWYPQFDVSTTREEILSTVKKLCTEQKWNQYEEYSKKCGMDFSSQGFYLPPLRDPSPAPRLRRFSSGDEVERTRQKRKSASF